MPTVRFQLRRDTAANWTGVNPTLGPGEPALETDTGKVKYGDGSSAWNSLPYSSVRPSAFIQTLMDDASAAAARATLGLASGTYTPTLTGVANVDTATAYACKYLRVGNIVHVAGKLDIDCTAVALTQLGISLPIASNLAGDGDARGTAASLIPETMVIRGDATNDRAEMIYTAVSTANHGVSFQFTYEVL